MNDEYKPATKRKTAAQRHPLAVAFGEYLKEARKAKDISQAELSFDSGTDRTYVSLMERGLSAPSLLVMEALSKALGISLTELVAGFEAHAAKARPRNVVPRRQNEASLASKIKGLERIQGSRRSPLR
jgi:transcriptional regulator with XRE-family HTH domain